jgi:outer membrane protein TolC
MHSFAPNECVEERYARFQAEDGRARVLWGAAIASRRSRASEALRGGAARLLLVAAASAMFSPSIAAAQVRREGQPPATDPPRAPATTSSAPQVPDLVGAVPGGITAEQVAIRAAATSYQAKAAEHNATAAAARTEEAFVRFLPRVELVGRATKLSHFTPPSLGPGGFVVTTQPPGTINPSPTYAAGGSFPLVFEQYLTQATIAIPISDYLLKINKAFTATIRQEEAARHDIAAARAKSYSDGKIAYFTWLRARGAVVVAQQSLAVARAHLKDAENQFAVGNASKADVLRAQTAVAAAELAVERAKSGVEITERQVRIAMHAKEDEKLEPGESLDSPIPPAPTNPRALVSEALASRPEIKSIDKNAEAARKLAAIQRANRYPSLSGFGDVTYANPNPRRFPQQKQWFPTWAIGAQITWSPNDFIGAGPGAADAEARAAALEAQKAAVRDGIELEVTQAYQAVLEADTAIVTTTRQLESAEEGYRVARELFNAGRGTSTTLIDAETALAQTRFEHLNAKVDARLARIRLEHAVGRDVK